MHSDSCRALSAKLRAQTQEYLLKPLLNQRKERPNSAKPTTAHAVTTEEQKVSQYEAATVLFVDVPPQLMHTKAVPRCGGLTRRLFALRKQTATKRHQPLVSSPRDFKKPVGTAQSLCRFL